MDRTELLVRRLLLAAHVMLSLLIVPVGFWLAPVVDRGECVLGELEFGHERGLHGEPEWKGQDTAREPIQWLEAVVARLSEPDLLSGQGDHFRPRMRAVARRAPLPDASEQRHHREALAQGASSKFFTSLYLENRSILC